MSTRSAIETIPTPIAFVVHSLRPGFIARCSVRSHAHAPQTAVMTPAGLNIVLVLAGQVNVAYGNRAFRFGPTTTTRGVRHEGGMVALAEPDSFIRPDAVGHEERKISLSLSPEWLEQSGLNDQAAHREIHRFCQNHLAIARWQPSRRLLDLAEQMLYPPAFAPALQQLHQESRAIELAGEALASLIPAQPATLPAREKARMQQLRDLLDSGDADNWSLADITLEIGLHEHALQRYFRASFGCTVVDYVRRRKLEQARFAIEQHDISVSDAALQAGYNSPANFATAFKRLFGISPGQLRSRLRR
ncbi:helix-turn-helix transcriptional regulator [Chitinimonas sp. BJB300]|uniref:helix-turn-helix transcriptional regulator n=1 Tax=Chitinimonas sp. BJB300 TaxID=1559339 RepID=UPI000C0F504D|nr:AraC family transcriptional regulator [Chitinimonas sp. BJB300]PHV09860.1 AraC family transcriptional regulator [Chitinimonas sp. BJB300]TSJ87407.1 helix-turn-helix transcriptional regulator [Chitinimonas sp. BJB300]